MAGRGSVKGERRGGRQKGTPNKANVERALLAKRIMEEQQGRPGRKLAREVLDDFMHLFMGMAAIHQPLPDGVAAGPGQKPDEAKFLTFAGLAVTTAEKLAPYQSSRLKAIMISQETPPGGLTAGPGQDGQDGSMERMSPQQAYRLLRDADVIDVSPAAQVVGGKKVANGKG